MEDQAPDLTTHPNTVNSPMGNKEEKSPTMFIVIGVVVVIVIFAAAVFALSYSNQPANNTTSQNQDSNAITSTSDLDKVSEELDKADLESYESELDQNDTDSADF